jgi:uncharacterized membrane protein YhaH (DUF805 family)
VLWPISPIVQGSLPKLIYLAIVVQVAGLMPIRHRMGVYHVTTGPLVAAGLLSPGPGVALVAWLFSFDGRVPGKDTRWWTVLVNRAVFAIAHGVASVIVFRLIPSTSGALPVKTVVYGLGLIALNWPLTAMAFSLLHQRPFWPLLRENLSLATLRSNLVLAFTGGLLYLVLLQPVGYWMGIGFLGILVAVRANMADANRHEEMKTQTLELAAQALDARDSYTESHSVRVADLAGRLGEAMGLGPREIDNLHLAGSLHDLGKIGIRDSVLNKSGPLTNEEWELMKTHPDIGADMVAKHSALAHVAPMIRHHHERWDGRGYPHQLQAREIPQGARILAVADSFDTITSPRHYRTGVMTTQEAVVDIASRAEVWYDPAVVHALQRVYPAPAPKRRVQRPSRKVKPKQVGAAEPVAVGEGQ